MKTNYYELFDNGTPEREESVDNVRLLTLRKMEQTQRTRHAVRPLGKVLLAAALVLVLVGSAFAVPAIINALTGVQTVQGAKQAVYFDGSSVLARQGYLEVTPVVTPNPDAPERIETYYIPGLADAWTPLSLYHDGTDISQVFCAEWQLPDGRSVGYTQYVLGMCHGDSTLDTVQLGFDQNYEIEQRQYGEMTAQCIIVPPSSTETAQGTLHDDGRKQIYWSDGNYLFSLNVDYAIAEDLVEEIIKGLRPVDSVLPYVRIVSNSPTPAEQIPVTEFLFPTAVPEGWELAPTTGSGSDSDRCWVWNYGGMSGMELNQTTNLDVYDTTMLDWLGSTEDWTRAEVTVQGNPATAFESETEACLLWKTDKECFVLQSSGPEHLNIEALLKIAESLKPM